jgi:hypothetical protein
MSCGDIQIRFPINTRNKILSIIIHVLQRVIYRCVCVCEKEWVWCEVFKFKWLFKFKGQFSGVYVCVHACEKEWVWWSIQIYVTIYVQRSISRCVCVRKSECGKVFKFMWLSSKVNLIIHVQFGFKFVVWEKKNLRLLSLCYTISCNDSHPISLIGCL